MVLILGNASGPMRAAMTLAAKLKTVTDFATFFLGQFAAVGAGFPSRIERLALRSANIEELDPILLC